MNYVTSVLHFLFENRQGVFFVCAVVIALFATASISADGYAKLNSAIKKSSKVLSKCAGDLVAFQRSLPVLYQYQWQAYIRLKGVYPRQVFRFLPQKQRKPLVVSAGLCTILCQLVVVYGIASGGADERSILSALCLFLGFSVVYGAVMVSNRIKQRRACAHFNTFVGYMDAYFGKNYHFEVKDAESKAETEDLIKKINFLRQNGVPEENAQKIGALLNAQSLEKVRSVEQQRQLNNALNGLVRVISRDMSANTPVDAT